MATRPSISFLAFVLALLCAPVLAHAQDYDAAGKHFANGQERYSAKRFHTAAMEFQAAYDITKDPVLLFNVGDAWQKAGEGKQAIGAYRAYLKERPTAQDRSDVEKRIALIDGKKQKLVDQSVAGDKAEAVAMAAAPIAPPPQQTPPPSPVAIAEPTSGGAPTTDAAAAPATPSVPPVVEPAPVVETTPKLTEPPPPQVGILEERPASRLRIAAWSSVAATIALLTTGAILGLAAQARGDEIERRLNFVDSSGQPSTFDAGAKGDFGSLRDEGNLYNGLAIGFYSAAGAMAVTTTVLFLVDWKRGKHAAADSGVRAFRLAPQVGPGSAGMVLGGQF